MSLLHALRAAFRSLRRSPGATLVSLGVLALGIGAATALFSLYNALVLRPLPVPGGERMAQLVMVTRNGTRSREWGLGLDDFQALRGLGGPVEALVLEEARALRLQAGALNTSRPAALTSPDYFQALGLRPRLGTGYAPGQPGVVLGEGLWRTAFGERTSLEGCRVQVNGAWLPVLGVAPKGFGGLKANQAVDLWVSLEAMRAWSEESYQAHLTRQGQNFVALVRLAPGATRAQGEAALQARVQDWRYQDEDPQAPQVRLRSFADRRQKAWKDFLPQGAVLWTAVGLLLLLACLNVAQLQAARAFEQRREEATRIALGGNPLQLLAKAAAELGLLIAGGTALALPVAMLLAEGLSRFAPPSMGTFTLDARLDGRVLGFAVGLLALMGLALTGFTAWRLLRQQPAEGLRDGTGGLGRFALAHRALLGIQVALALALLWSAASALGGLRRTLARPLGFDLHGVSVVSFQVPDGTPEAERLAKLAQLREVVDRVPGIQSASLSAVSPLDPLRITFSLLGEEGRTLSFKANLVSRDYFRTLRIPLLEGREFNGGDKAGAPRVLIVSRAQARLLWPEGGPVAGRRLGNGPNAYTVAGVVEDHVLSDLTMGPRAFVPLEQCGINWQCLLVRSDRPLARLLPELDRAIAAVDPRWPLLKAEPLEAKLLRQQQPQRLASALLGGLGLLAGILAFAGIFGLQSHLTAQRGREAGLRVALGATPGSVAATFSRAVLLPALAGLAGGTLLVLVSRRMLEQLLGGLGAVEWPGLLLAALALLATAFAAAWIPAFRAARVHPAQALRSE